MYALRIAFAVIGSFFVTLALSGCVVQRDTGVWRGTVIIREEGRLSVLCTMELEISHTDEDLSVSHQTLNCPQYSMKWHIGDFEVQGNSLWRDGAYAGWTGEDSATLDLNDRLANERHPLAATSVSMSWMRIGTGLDFTEETRFSETVFRRTSGLLSRVP